jgi:hypothetical protein
MNCSMADKRAALDNLARSLRGKSLVFLAGLDAAACWKIRDEKAEQATELRTFPFFFFTLLLFVLSLFLLVA